MQTGKRKAAAAVVLAIVLIACVVGWLAPSHARDGVRAILGFVGRRVETAFTGQKLEIVLICAAGLGLEAVLVGWRNSSVFRLLFARRRSAIVDAVFFGVLMTGFADIMSIILTFGISVESGRVVNWIISQYGWSRIALPAEGVLPLAAGFGVYWLLTTFFSYWGHRLMHTRYLWHLHRFHHAATELNLITVFRQHPVEPVILNFLSVVSPLLFFKVSDQILLIYLVVGTTVDLLAHSHLPWTYGWIGSWIFLSPRVHQVHHSVEDEHRDLHFSSCPLWDHVFGTWYTGTKRPAAYGVPDNQYEDRPLRQFVLDALKFYAAIGGGLRSRLRRRQLRPADRARAAIDESCSSISNYSPLPPPN
ncbi:sterol desaturase family protein [Bradyrhizobium sp.]|uniref:sterol desaturase family protein n=1 Tax=Bradyrhizobium sp. TaxID=376 RepID=UPI003C757324